MTDEEALVVSDLPVVLETTLAWQGQAEVVAMVTMAHRSEMARRRLRQLVLLIQQANEARVLRLYQVYKTKSTVRDRLQQISQ